jgi:amino acid transporter
MATSSKLDERPQLGHGAIGVPDLVFFVVAAASPLAVMAGVAPLAVARGGIGTPTAYALTAVVLAVFAVGYTAMSRHITNAGAFYAYVTHGLGRELGLGAALLATYCYSALAVGLAALFAVFANTTFADLLGIDVAWQAWAFAALGLAWFLGQRSIEVSARVLGVALCLETGILLLVAGAVVLDGGASGLSAEPFAPSHIFGADAAVMFAVAAGAFIGFEATAMLSEEARDPHRTVRRATFVAVGLLALTYAFVTWATVMAFGTDSAQAVAQADPVAYLFAVADQYVGGWAVDAMRVLVVTSALAAFLAFHNAASRYMFALARAGVLPAGLASTHRRHRSPATANLVQTIIAAAAITMAIVASLDPYDDVFVLTGITSVTAIIALEALTSLAVIGYFRANRRQHGVVTTLVAPALAATGLLAMLIVTVANIDVLTARPGVTGRVLLGVAAGVFALGVGYAILLRSRRAGVYDGLATASLTEP